MENMQVLGGSEDRFISMFALAHRAARRYGRIGIHDPEDLAQTALLKALKSGTASTNPEGWICTILRSVAADAGRSNTRRKQIVAPDFELPLLNLTVCEAAEDQHYVPETGMYRASREQSEPDVMPRIRDAIARLAPPLQRALVLYLDGYSYMEIAELTGHCVNSVRSRLYSARKQAQKFLIDLV